MANNQVVTVYDSQVVNGTSVPSNEFDFAAFDTLEIQLFKDNDGAAGSNLTFQHSADGENWVTDSNTEFDLSSGGSAHQFDSVDSFLRYGRFITGATDPAGAIITVHIVAKEN